MRPIQTEPFADLWGRPGVPKPPKPPVPPEPLPRARMRVLVQTTDGQLAGSLIAGEMGRPTWHVVGVPVSFEELEFTAPAGVAYGDLVSLLIQATGWADQPLEVPFAPTLTVTMRRAVVLLEPLVSVGQFFQLEHSGADFTTIGTSAFSFLKQILEGADITPIVRQYVAIGLNESRVFGGYNGGLGRFVPSDYGDFFGGLRAMATCFQSVGMRGEFTVFPDVKRWMPEPNRQRDWMAQVEDTLAPFAAFMSTEGENEGDYLDNGADGLMDYTPKGVVMACHGSCLQDGGTRFPIWKGRKGYATYHPARGGEYWARRVGHNAKEDVADPENVPTKSNELKRPDEDGYHPAHYFDAGANGALLCAGSTFNSKQRGSLFTVDLDCATAFVAGAKAVDLGFRRGSYTAGHLHDSPLETDTAERVHGKILGNSALMVVTKKDDETFHLKPRNGWRVVAENQSVIELSR